MNLLLVLMFSVFAFFAQAEDLDSYEKTCKEIGFKPKTEKFGDCVLELRRREKDITKINPQEFSIKTTESPKVKGDGSFDDITCHKYGFEVSTTEYSQCRLQLDNARKQLEAQQAQFKLQQEQYLKQKADYDARVAEYEKEKERQKGLRLLRYSLGILNGESPVNALSSSLGLPPVAPQSPAFQNYTIRLPGGRVTNCTYSSGTNYMNCF